MAADRVEAYADALVSVAQAEGNLEVIEDELFGVARAIEGSDELRMTLTDRQIPAPRRQQVVEDILGGKTSHTTTALVSMIVGADRASDLSKIVESAVGKSAAARNKSVAEVRSAIPLDDDQKARLAQALNTATGKDVTIKVIVDPSIKGGIIATVDDEVIDGSVRTRLTKLRESF